MGNITLNRRASVVAWALASLGPPLAAETPPVDWWQVDRAVVDELFTKDLFATADGLAAKDPPRDPAELLRRLSVRLLV